MQIRLCFRYTTLALLTAARLAVFVVLAALALKAGALLAAVVLLAVGLTIVTYGLIVRIAAYSNMDARGWNPDAIPRDGGISNRRFQELLSRGARIKLVIASILLFASLFAKVILLSFLLALWVLWELLWVMLVWRRLATDGAHEEQKPASGQS
ncbi:MAG: hypothetical protein Q7T82_17280 [Armatimonadota bacterium]|nr:hypothetical protein [Armatimonadota bacterium]